MLGFLSGLMSYFDTQINKRIGLVLKCRQPVILALINGKVIDRNISVTSNIHIPNSGRKFSVGFHNTWSTFVKACIVRGMR